MRRALRRGRRSSFDLLLLVVLPCHVAARLVAVVAILQIRLQLGTRISLA